MAAADCLCDTFPGGTPLQLAPAVICRTCGHGDPHLITILQGGSARRICETCISLGGRCV